MNAILRKKVITCYLSPGARTVVSSEWKGTPATDSRVKWKNLNRKTAPPTFPHCSGLPRRKILRSTKSELTEYHSGIEYEKENQSNNYKINYPYFLLKQCHDVQNSKSQSNRPGLGLMRPERRVVRKTYIW